MKVQFSIKYLGYMTSTNEVLFYRTFIHINKILTTKGLILRKKYDTLKQHVFESKNKKNIKQLKLM